MKMEDSGWHTDFWLRKFGAINSKSMVGAPLAGCRGPTGWLVAEYNAGPAKTSNCVKHTPLLTRTVFTDYFLGAASKSEHLFVPLHFILLDFFVMSFLFSNKSRFRI